MKIKLHLYCPTCGARFLHGKEAADENLKCKRCRTKVKATYGDKKIYMELMEERQGFMKINSS